MYAQMMLLSAPKLIACMAAVQPAVQGMRNASNASRHAVSFRARLDTVLIPPEV